MFDNQRYLTHGIATLPPEIVSFIWTLIDELLSQSEHNVDYLQVFTLYEGKDATGKPIQVVKHSQEEPEYDAIYNIYLPNEPIQAKIFVIDSSSYSTMLLAEEY